MAGVRTTTLDGLLGTSTGMSDSEARKAMRRRLFMLLGGVVVIAALIAFVWWYIVASGYVSTDDAYVDASVAEITPQIDGLVRSVPVNDTQTVKRGQILVVIDPVDQQIAVAQAEANYGQATRRVEQYFANASAGVAQVSSKRADLQRAQLDYRRRMALASTGAVSGDELSTAKDALDTAVAGVEMAQRQLLSQQALIRGTTVQNNPEVMTAKAQLDTARLGLSRTVLRAPVDGIVAQSVVQVGQRVQVGTQLMTVVPVAQVYVNANFKEGQLRRVRIGQGATLTSDLYGSSVVFHGKVAGVGGGTGSAFAVIPAQNATGNWIKVVQRLPVRIALDPAELARHPLRVGLSMDATIDIAH
jgi:membrane fusion protein (multidrug efflux system)